MIRNQTDLFVIYAMVSIDVISMKKKMLFEPRSITIDSIERWPLNTYRRY